jgi:hypothetical protein
VFIQERKRHLSIDLSNLTCPICGVLVNGGAKELRAHLDYELERLEDDEDYTDSSLYTNKNLSSSLALLNALKKVGLKF